MARSLSVTSKKPIDPQHKRFIETARQLECDEDKGRFEKKLAKISGVRPPRKRTPNEGADK
jgi:hypothetical protein